MIIVVTKDWISHETFVRKVILLLNIDDELFQTTEITFILFFPVFFS